MKALLAIVVIAGLYSNALAEEGSGRILVKPICVSTTAGCDFWAIGWLDTKGQFHAVQRLKADELRERLHEMIKAGEIHLPAPAK